MKNQSDAGLEARLTAPLEIMLASFAPIGIEGRDLVRRSFSGAPQHQPSGTAIPMDPERNQARLVASGWIARGAMLNDGRRQIIGLSLPGDVIVASGSVDATSWSGPSPMSSRWTPQPSGPRFPNPAPRSLP